MIQWGESAYPEERYICTQVLFAPWIPERSATRLREADLNILSKLGK
jgi:hypothetical protein